MLVVRATLALLAGQIRAGLSDLRAVVALTQRGFIPVELARTHRQLGSALLTTGSGTKRSCKRGLDSESPPMIIAASRKRRATD